MKYDYVIIGGGPTGMTLAWYLSRYFKVALIDENIYIGGCHGVDRHDDLFSEHGPRIYIDNYLMFIDLLKEMDINFYDYFTQYQFGITNIGGNITDHISIKEMLKLLWGFLRMNKSYREITLEEFLNKKNFTVRAKDYFDRLCRLTDGGGIDQYTLYNFYQLINQNFFYKIYQPKHPNDIGIFNLWKNKLVDRGVDIYLDTKVIEIENINNNVTSVITNNKRNMRINGNKFIFAIPPYSLSKIMEKSHNRFFRDSFGSYLNFRSWSEKTNYITYIPVMLHWKDKLSLKKKWGFPASSWGIGHIVLSDYMNFNNPKSKTVISTVITRPNTKNKFGLTANESSDKNYIIKEVLQQLREHFDNLPEPDYAIMTQNYYDNSKKEWISKHTGFMTTKYGYINPKSVIFTNLYTCGPHNGKSDYSFTSVEASVVNAIDLVNDLLSEFNYSKIPIKSGYTIFTLINCILLIILLVIIYYWYQNIE